MPTKTKSLLKIEGRRRGDECVSRASVMWEAVAGTSIIAAHNEQQSNASGSSAGWALFPTEKGCGALLGSGQLSLGDPHIVHLLNECRQVNAFAAWSRTLFFLQYFYPLRVSYGAF